MLEAVPSGRWGRDNPGMGESYERESQWAWAEPQLESPLRPAAMALQIVWEKAQVSYVHQILQG